MGNEGSLRVGILGSLVVTRHGRDVPVRGDRQRGLLALLAVHANRPVPTTALADALFDPPSAEGSANAVRIAVSRLRRVLGGDELQTDPGGYRLHLPDDRLDAAAFERLLGEGRAAGIGGDPAEAGRRLREALQLWRGTPLGDLPDLDALSGERRRLSELELLARVELAEAELSLGAGDALVPELERLVAANPLAERLRAQLMRALYRAGRQADALAVYRDASETLRGELGLEPGRELQELERLVLRHDSALDAVGAGRGRERAGAPSAPRSPRSAPDGRVCPFKGLAPFDTADADFFFGRARLVLELVARLSEAPLLGILGASGIGKSSVLRAGLLPTLRDGALPGSRGWRQVVLRPGEHPPAALAAALGGEPDAVIAGLSGDDHLILAVDQLEELFTACEDPGERARFLDALVAAARDGARRVSIVCTLRADFYGRLSAHGAFAELISQSHVLVGPMDRLELTEAVEGPAARAGLEVEPALVDALVADVVDEPGGLPLLSTALLELWRGRAAERLEYRSYRASGGLHAAVSRVAEAAFARLSAPQQRTAVSILLRLAAEEDGAFVRRRVPLAQVHLIPGAETVALALTDARLTTVSDGALELSHEALLREWPRYRAWLEEDRAGRHVRTHLSGASVEWEARGRDPAELYRGGRLAAALAWSAEHEHELGRGERAFLEASRLQAGREAEREASQNRRLRALLAGTTVLLVLAVVAGVIALRGQRAASDSSRRAAAEARTARAGQLAAEAGAEPRLDVAMLLAREAVRLDDSPQTEGTLLSTLLRNPAVLGSHALAGSSSGLLALSPDGKTAAIADSSTGTVALYDAASWRRLHGPLGDFTGQSPPAFSPDGRLLAYPDGASLIVRAMPSLALVAKLAFDAGYDTGGQQTAPAPGVLIDGARGLAYFAYSQPGSAGSVAFVDRWTLGGGRRVTARLGAGPLLATQLTDGGRRLVAVSPSAISVFALPSLRPVSRTALRLGHTVPSLAAISPDASTVALGSRTGTVSFVAAATGRAVHGPVNQGSTVSDLVYAPSGQAAVSLSPDGRVAVWNPLTGARRAVLVGPPGRLVSAAISPDAAVLYTSALDGTTLQWDLTGRDELESEAAVDPPGCCDGAVPPGPAMAVSSDGREVAVAAPAGGVEVLSTATLSPLLRFSALSGPVTALAFAPGGHELAVGGAGTVGLWSLGATPHLVRSYTGLRAVSGLSETIPSLAISPDGAVLAASDDSAMVRRGGQGAELPVGALALWHRAGGATSTPTRVLGSGIGPGEANVLAFSPRDHLLAVSLLHGGVVVLDDRDGRVRRTLATEGEDIVSLAFAPDGLLALGSTDGGVALYNPLIGTRESPSVMASSGPVTSIAFDPSGRRFVTAGAQDGAIKLWSTVALQQVGPGLSTGTASTDTVAVTPSGGGSIVAFDGASLYTWPTSLAVWTARACAVAGRDLTPQEWARYVPGLPDRPVCP